MHRFARVVLGYHGCLEPLATKLLSGKLDVFRWPSSENRWDWLGSGIYFWEHGPSRALRWAEDKARRSGGRPAVVGAVIQLGRCFDLTDVTHTELLGKAYEQVTRFYRARGKRLPCNEGADRDRKKRELDCLMINWCLAIAQVNGVEYQTVRGVFLEGPPVYRGAMIRTESHIQIAVRDPSCILGVFRPTL